MGWYRNRLVLRAIVEQFSVGALDQRANRGAQIEDPRRDLLMQPLLIKHRGQKTDRHHDEGLVLRRP